MWFRAALIAGESRLVFKVSDGFDVPYTLEGWLLMPLQRYAKRLAIMVYHGNYRLAGMA